MKEKIINFTDIPGAQQHKNPLNHNSETVLEFAKDKFSAVIIIGMDKVDGNIVVSSSIEDGFQLNYMIDVAKKRLFDILENNQ